jgi:hypothetical protein
VRFVVKKVHLLFLVFAFALLAFGQGDIPAFHKTAPGKGAKLPPILTQDQMFGSSFQYAYQRKAYLVATKIGNVLYQLPCYCYCDRIGHRSLRTCYESTHAANCSHCMKEAYYAYFQTKQGKTPKQIRDGIIKGEWRSIDLEQAADQVKN